jgi:hypothetical protein
MNCVLQAASILKDEIQVTRKQEKADEQIKAQGGTPQPVTTINAPK